jgi:hypothetical protein
MKRPLDLTKIFVIASAARADDTDIGWSKATYHQALLEIANLAENISKTIFGADDLAQDLGLSADDDIKDLQTKYRIHPGQRPPGQTLARWSSRQ